MRKQCLLIANNPVFNQNVFLKKGSTSFKLNLARFHTVIYIVKITGKDFECAAFKLIKS